MPVKRKQTPPSPGFPIVGIAASAGGLEAVSRLLRALPPTTGMGFVLIQHLEPTRASMLVEILSRSTSLRVVEAADRMRVERDRLYVIPPGRDLTISAGVLRTSPRRATPAVHRPADKFLVSLAQDVGHRAIAVILSGTANDGSLGCEAIKADGGIAFAQDESALHDGMPKSAVAAGCVDFVLAPEQIAAKLIDIGTHPFIKISEGDRQRLPEDHLHGILDILHNTQGAEFHQYKRSTVQRRVARRMVLMHLEDPEAYRQHLQENPTEAQSLYQDILIGVTSFFRDPEAFETLKKEVFPELTRDRSRHDPLRIWVVGCATGEEAYSLAILATEFAEETGKAFQVQIFASDLNGIGIERARTGVYPRSIARDITPERLQKYFTETDGGYRVAKAIREVTIFAEHNALTDPPFSHIDLVSCRNLLIYMESSLQRRMIQTFHYAIRPGGYLWLGSSETIGSFRDLFEATEAKHRIFLRKAGSKTPLRIALRTQRGEAARAAIKPLRREALPVVVDAQREADRLLLSRYAPAGVLISADLEVVQFRGDTSPYLVLPQGKASLGLLKMLREGLLLGVRGAVQKALREESPVRVEGLAVGMGRARRSVTVEVTPIRGSTLRDNSFLVIFESAGPASRKTAGVTAAKPSKSSRTRAAEEREVVRMGEELAATREYLQSVIEQQESINEELTSANEEVQSANEELQSINEELETSKEEVQSNNEELATVNDELSARNLDLSRANTDLGNLLQSVEVTIVRLSTDFRIQWFTPTAEKTLSLIRADVGRSILDFNLAIGVPDFEGRLRDVAQNGVASEIETRDRQGNWYSLRIRPYRTRENQIDGLLMVLVDIDSLKQAEESLRRSEARFRSMADSAPVQIWMSGVRGLEFVNRPFREYFGVDPSDMSHFSWAEHAHTEDSESLAAAFHDGLAASEPFQAQARLKRFDGEFRWHKIVGVPRMGSAGEFLGHIGSSFDVTDLKQAEVILREADRTKNEFLAMLAHELRNPLAPLRNVVHLLSNPEVAGQWLPDLQAIMERQVQNITRMVDDLLDVARVTQGKVQIRKSPIDLKDVLSDAVAQVSLQFEAREQTLEVKTPDRALNVNGDSVRLEQAIVNLLTNASKFSPQGDRALMTVRVYPGPQESGIRAQEWVEISVRDNGAGIDPDTIVRIFEPFIQADGTLARSQGGLGLGLTLVRSIVEVHGGTVSATSEGPGSGSEFVIRLPLLPVEAVPREDAENPKLPGRRKADSRRVLVVDDNADAGDSLALLLRLSRHEVTVVRDGSSAVEIVEEFKPDFVFLDIGLPGKDGYQIARELRDSFGGDCATLVAITGYGQAADRVRSREAGFDHHFTKPVDFDALQRLLADPPRSAG